MIDLRQPEFVGRDVESSALIECLDRTPALVLIQGEAGIGKSRLVREVLAARPETTALVAACPHLEKPFPLGAVVDGLRRFDRVARELELSPLAGALRPLFPEWSSWLPSALDQLDDPLETRHRTFRALRDLVHGLGVHVLVVEDAHWADMATLEWLLSLTAAEAATQGSTPSIVVTYRPDDVPPRSLLRRLTSRPPAGMELLRIQLEPLDVDQTRQLVASMLDAEEVSEQFATFLREHADGVPLVVEELIRLMRDRHDIIHQSGSWTRRVLEELHVPPTVRDSVLERVDRLPSKARAVLWAAAILAAPADEAQLTTVSGLGQPDGRRGVANALAAGLLREVRPGRLAFRHVLDAKAVEDAIPRSESWHLHARALAALEQSEPQAVDRLARHAREANDTEAWCSYAAAAADAAWETGDDRTAVVILLDLLTNTTHPLDRQVRLTRKLGEAAFFGSAAVADLAERVVSALRDLLATEGLRREERGEFRLLMGRMLWDLGEVKAAKAEYEAAVPDLDDRPDLAVRAMMNLAIPNVRDCPADCHLDWLSRATGLLPEVDARSFRVVNRPGVLLLLGEESGWPAIADISLVGGGPNERRRAAAGLVNVAEAIQVWGRYEEARRQLDVAVQEIERSGNWRQMASARVVRAYLDWYTGRWSGLRAAMADVAESEECQPGERLSAAQLIGVLDLVAGARTAGDRQLLWVETEYERRGVLEPWIVTALTALGRRCLSQGRTADALDTTRQAIDLISRKGVWLWATDIAPAHVQALTQTEAFAEAEDFLAEFGGRVDHLRAPGAAASVLTCRAVLTRASGHAQQAATQFVQAAAAWARMPRPYDELLAMENHGLCLYETDDRNQAFRALARVEERLRHLGARWDADRIARLLRRSGVEVARTWRRGPRGYGDELSPREREVVELVSRGMTNKQIAEELFISPKTVSRHLGSAMRKLEVSSRTALAMAAAEASVVRIDNNS